MNLRRFVPLSTLVGFAALVGSAACLAAEPDRRTWTIDGVEREAIIYKPATKSEGGSPLVFGFHGHGGNMTQAARSFHLHDEWPEAVVVYMQGVPTPGHITDPEGRRNGWQRTVGDQNDRDLKFFDAVLAAIKKDYAIDPQRIYSTGHSNGGAFTYLLWSARPDTFAAVAPSGAAGAVRMRGQLKPCPCLHLAGETDPLVKFEWQEASMKAVRAVNGCEGDPVKWADGCLEYKSPTGSPFVSFIHSGGHRYPDEAPKLIVKFFREHEKG